MTLRFIWWWRAIAEMSLILHPRISSDKTSLLSDEEQDTETERSWYLSSWSWSDKSLFESLSTKLSLQLFLFLPSLSDTSSRSNLHTEKFKNRESSGNEERSKRRRENYLGGGEMREGGVAPETERRSRAEATLSSRGHGNFAIQFSFFLSFFLFLSKL